MIHIAEYGQTLNQWITDLTCFPDCVWSNKCQSESGQPMFDVGIMIHNKCILMDRKKLCYSHRNGAVYKIF